MRRRRGAMAADAVTHTAWRLPTAQVDRSPYLSAPSSPSDAVTSLAVASSTRQAYRDWAKSLLAERTVKTSSSLFRQATASMIRDRHASHSMVDALRLPDRPDRQSDVQGKSVTVRVESGVSRIIKKKTHK